MPSDIRLNQEKSSLAHGKWCTIRRSFAIPRTQSCRRSIHHHRISRLDVEPSFSDKAKSYLDESWRSIRQRIYRRNTCDPYVVVQLIPNKHIMNYEGNNLPMDFDEFQFKTKPIYGGGSNVLFTNADNNEYKFPISTDEINIYSITLQIEVYDHDYFGKDRLIGKNSIQLLGLQDDIHMFIETPIHNEDTQFCGKVEIAALRSAECLEITVLNASSLLQVNHYFFYVIMCNLRLFGRVLYRIR